MAILTTILGWLTKEGIGAITTSIADAYVAARNAETEQERIHAEQRVRTLEARRDVMIAEAPNRLNTWVRAGFALPFMIYYAKLVLWDKVLGLGVTDALSADLKDISKAVIGFYFLAEGAIAVTRILKR